MKRVAGLIASRGLYVPSSATDYDRVFLESLQDGICQSEAMLIDNVVEYLMGHQDQDVRDVAVVPPFSRTWLEARVPKGIPFIESDGQRIEPNQMVGARFGVYVMSQTTSEFDPHGAGWEVQMWRITHFPARRPQPNVQYGCRLWLDTEGRIRQGVGTEIAMLECHGTATRSVLTWPMVHASLFPVLMAFAFANCRNVRAVAEPRSQTPDPRSPPAGSFSMTYRVLEIGPVASMAAQRRSTNREGQEIATRRALHICRGHFAQYGADRPLFGRFSGNFWRPAHTRGSTDNGLSLKDYSVRAAR